MSAIDTFRRAMRRHERRARRMGFDILADTLALGRIEPRDPPRFAAIADDAREVGARNAAFFYGLAADAVERYERARVIEEVARWRKFGSATITIGGVPVPISSIEFVGGTVEYAPLTGGHQ